MFRASLGYMAKPSVPKQNETEPVGLWLAAYNARGNIQIAHFIKPGSKPPRERAAILPPSCSSQSLETGRKFQVVPFQPSF